MLRAKEQYENYPWIERILVIRTLPHFSRVVSLPYKQLIKVLAKGEKSLGACTIRLGQEYRVISDV